MIKLHYVLAVFCINWARFSFFCGIFCDQLLFLAILIHLVRELPKPLLHPPKDELLLHKHLRPTILLRISNIKRKKIGSCYGLGPKIQDGRQAGDMVTLTFFLWEINSKFFFLAQGFGVLAMRWNYLQPCARGIQLNSAEFDHFLRFISIFPLFINILISGSQFLQLYPCFGGQLIKWWHLENCHTTRVTRSRGILAELCYFSAGCKHFPSIYHDFDSRNMVILAISMARATRN